MSSYITTPALYCTVVGHGLKLTTLTCPCTLAEYLANLRFFVREGMHEGDGVDYVIVVQEV